MSVEDQISCDDPQFMNMLEACLRMEIHAAKETVFSLKAEIKEMKANVQLQLQARKELKEQTKNTQENILILTATLRRLTKHMHEVTEKIDSIKLNMDDEYKIMKFDSQKYENIITEYKETWDSYHAKYEEFPLAKVRKQTKTRVEKLRIEKMIIEQKILTVQSIKKQRDRIAWLRLRARIIDFAKAMLNNMKLKQKYVELETKVDRHREELKLLVTEVALQTKKKEEEERKRALKILEMPPPKINFSHMRSMYAKKQKVGILEKWNQACENSLDSMSIDTVMLEELCMAEEDSIPLTNQYALHPQSTPEHNLQSPLERQFSLVQLNEKETESNSGINETIQEDKPAEVTERNLFVVPKEIEHVAEERVNKNNDATPSRIPPLDKTAIKHKNEDGTNEDIEMKKMKLMSENDQNNSAGPSFTIATPGNKNVHSTQRSPRPRISKIETVRYNISPIRKFDRPNVNPSSMFTPRHYQYCDSSNISFSVENDMESFKDQMSSYAGSIHFSECSNISPPAQDVEMIPRTQSGASSQKSDAKINFPQFDFSSILKNNPSRTNLF